MKKESNENINLLKISVLLVQLSSIAIQLNNAEANPQGLLLIGQGVDIMCDDLDIRVTHSEFKDIIKSGYKKGGINGKK